ncbi:MAG: SDR family oxidoreductase [Bacteroidetes bacterium]|nr:SDR family oxidoreductase [Bacteroidota bacterium]
MKNLETILITGGAGFIGSNLCEFYVNKGVRVICLDNLLTGKESNIQPLLGKSNFTFVRGDIRDFDTCSELVKKVDAISHQAALGSVPRSIENPLPTNEINCHGFLNMLTAARQNNIKRFVYASSSSVYGDSAASPKKENQLGKPLSPYAVSKLTNELYGKVFFDLYGMETIGLRYFNVFGKNQDPNGAYAAAIPKFIACMKNNESPTIYGDGKQTRDFTYIKNVVLANQLALETTNTGCFGEAYNVACGKSYSLNEVVGAIRNELVKKGFPVADLEPAYVDQRKGDILNSLADISKISAALGYSARFDFDHGISEYITHM